MKEVHVAEHRGQTDDGESIPRRIDPMNEPRENPQVRPAERPRVGVEGSSLPGPKPYIESLPIVMSDAVESVLLGASQLESRDEVDDLGTSRRHDAQGRYRPKAG